MINIQSASLLNILSTNLKADSNVQAIARAIDPKHQEVSNAINQLLLSVDLEAKSELIIDLLAWQKHVDFYDSSLPTDTKRELVRQAEAAHRHKGTPWAIDQIVSTAFDEAVVSEWFEYGGDPFRFKVITADRMTDNKRYADIIRAINSAKNKRSRLETITIRRDNTANQFIGGVVSTLRIRTIRPSM
ncbi:phage tail protein I [Brevibacillus nitrificans]|uniref:phage tail protein I n=1 Tax=Brevibacillus nitrificans TaxID=651560 RepID=UPI002859797A|nr:phage tail protein I [Brevibacillus nitrificans]MDR7318925.1 phage tail P2-like protein [Brevibacillus nitrificans]